MKVPHRAGVYCLKAHNSRLIYIGSTNNLARRQAVHLYQIRKNDRKKGCITMIEAFINGDYVNFEVIEICDNYLEREQHWINIYKLDNSFKLVNQFDANREGGKSTQEFKEKQSEARRKLWQKPEYREKMLEKFKGTYLTAERLNKEVYTFNAITGRYLGKYISGKEAAKVLNLLPQSLNAAARGKYINKFVLKDKIFIYREVLYKLDELLEAHQELRVISSEAWERWKSTMNVQRLTSEQAKQ